MTNRPGTGVIRRLAKLPTLLQRNFGLASPRYYFGSGIGRRDDFQQGGEAVLLINGYFQTRRTMETLERRLRQDGFLVMSFRLGGFLGNFNTTSIPRLARRIDEKLDRIRQDTGLSRIHVVGHSKGGLVARQLLCKTGSSEVMGNVVTLGSPHLGTPLALVGAGLALGFLGKSVWQMMPGSPFLRSLATADVPINSRLVSIYSKTDLLCPPSAARLTRGPRTANLVVNEIGHMELVEDAWVYGLVLRALREPCPPEPGGYSQESGGHMEKAEA